MYMLSGMGVLIDFDQQSPELSIVGNNLDLGHLPFMLLSTLCHFLKYGQAEELCGRFNLSVSALKQALQKCQTVLSLMCF